MTQPDQNSHCGKDDSVETMANIRDTEECSCGMPGEPVDKTQSSLKTSDSEKSACKKSYSQLKKKNSRKKREKNAEVEETRVVEKEAAGVELPAPRSSWLLRLFESKLFDMAIAIAYLFQSKETGVLAYLGNKLFVSMMNDFLINILLDRRDQIKSFFCFHC